MVHETLLGLRHSAEDAAFCSRYFPNSTLDRDLEVFLGRWLHLA